MGFPGGSVVTICLLLQEMQQTWVCSLGREDLLEEGMATHSSVLAWRIPWTEEPAGLQSMGSQRVGHNLATECTAQKHSWLSLANVFIPSDFHLTGDTAKAAVASPRLYLVVLRGCSSLLLWNPRETQMRASPGSLH